MGMTRHSPAAVRSPGGFCFIGNGAFYKAGKRSFRSFFLLKISDRKTEFLSNCLYWDLLLNRTSQLPPNAVLVIESLMLFVALT